MSWPTKPHFPAPETHVRSSVEHPEHAALLARIGTCGWSALVSYGASTWSQQQLGACPEPGSSLAALCDLGPHRFQAAAGWIRQNCHGSPRNAGRTQMPGEGGTDSRPHRIQAVAGPPGYTGGGTSWPGNSVRGLGPTVRLPGNSRGRDTRSATVGRCSVDKGRRLPSLVSGGIRVTSGLPSP